MGKRGAVGIAARQSLMRDADRSIGSAEASQPLLRRPAQIIVEIALSLHVRPSSLQAGAFRLPLAILLAA
ncbi:hypothetical protein EAH84_14435 [Sphingomonas oligophenolica]|uniref:Uncharacterized protein n=2 Tax=Sphingomonas oligophenolica TaxID=301154 RepID=A0A502C731_9SPHN|nr:hypothetical protein EAH84_14435 [Sphingomonas oligophenolica]